jgi:hypothetical protein
MSKTTAPAHTFYISVLGLEGGEELHYNGRTWEVITIDASLPGVVRVYYVTDMFTMDWFVFGPDDMVTVS